MSDNLKRYCAIQRALKQHYPIEPTGNLARHLHTLAALISGILGCKKTHLPAIASKIPDGRKRESRSKRFARFLQNKTVTPETFFLPYATALIQSLPPGPLVLVMDGSVVGRGCMVLMLSVLHQKRALPLCWRVVQAKKGHFSQESHRTLLAQVKCLIPAQREVLFLGDEVLFLGDEVLFLGDEVLFLGDGEFDGCHLLQDITDAGWQYVCRTAKNVRLAEADWPEETFSLSALGLQPGDCVEITDLLFTAQRLGPVLVGAVWEIGQREPLLLVTNLDFLHEARVWYRKRFGIETFWDRDILGLRHSSPIRRAGAFLWDRAI